MNQRDIQEQNFLQELDANPEDLTQRRVFADWLEDQGDPRATTVRGITDYLEGNQKSVDVSQPELLWASVRAFAPPRKRINKFNHFQSQMLPVWRELWIAIGQSCGITNREQAEADVRLMYTILGQVEPTEFLWGRSPVESSELLFQRGPHFAFDSTLFRGGWVSPTFSASEKVKNTVNGEIQSELSRVVGNGTWKWIQNCAEKKLRNRGHQPHNWRDDHDNSLFLSCEPGTFAAYGLSRISFYHHVCGLSIHEYYQSLFSLTLNTGPWWPTLKTVILTEKPVELTTCKDGTLKRTTYADGFVAQKRKKRKTEDEDIPF